jgi:hypothetical protein
VHSQALEIRPQVAVIIFQKGEDAQIGFYAKGRAELVNVFKPEYGRYRFTAEQAWINDETFRKREVRISSHE